MRTIDDARAGGTGRFAGTAVFAPQAGGLAYSETGTLTLPDGTALTAERQYFWRQDGAEIAVEFADGRPFHRFGPGTDAARHWCDPDDYHVAYDFREWPVWHADWTVRGPRKDYRMRSTFAPAA